MMPVMLLALIVSTDYSFADATGATYHPWIAINASCPSLIRPRDLYDPGGVNVITYPPAASDIVAMDGVLVASVGIAPVVGSGNPWRIVTVVVFTTRDSRYCEVYIDGAFQGRMYGQSGSMSDTYFAYAQPEDAVIGLRSDIVGGGDIQLHNLSELPIDNYAATTQPIIGGVPTTQGGDGIIDSYMDDLDNQQKNQDRPIVTWKTDYEPATTWQQASEDMKALIDAVIPGSLTVTGDSAEQWYKFGLDGPNELIGQVFQSYGQIMTDYASLFVFTRAYGNVVIVILTIVKCYRILIWGFAWKHDQASEPPVPTTGATV
ncbi:MAG: hypothetical protein IT565_14060 [Rhodospirillales bacterium]|nr:hypothetical protein [Rhodospirillales bacterium]